MFLSAVVGSGLLTGVYWTFPPIFADAEVVAAVPSAPTGLVRTAALASIPVDVPAGDLTPSAAAHHRCIRRLAAGTERLRMAGGHTATFSKTEVVGGQVRPRETMKIKVRHEPFSVYMKWTEGNPGTELLYVAGKNDGEMTVRAGGWKGRVLGPLNLDPHGSVAMGESRHPVTEAGLLNLTDKLLAHRVEETGWKAGVTCEAGEATIDGRLCDTFTHYFDDPSLREGYRKSIVAIDRETDLVIHVWTYGWPGDPVPTDRLDAETLLEEYVYADIDLDAKFARTDFDVANAEYNLKRR